MWKLCIDLMSRLFSKWASVLVKNQDLRARTQNLRNWLESDRDRFDSMGKDYELLSNICCVVLYELELHCHYGITSFIDIRCKLLNISHDYFLVSPSICFLCERYLALCHDAWHTISLTPINSEHYICRAFNRDGKY